MEMKTGVNKWDLIKLKRFYTANKTINKTKRQSSEWEKISGVNLTIISKVSASFKLGYTANLLNDLRRVTSLRTAVNDLDSPCLTLEQRQRKPLMDLPSYSGQVSRSLAQRQGGSPLQVCLASPG